MQTMLNVINEIAAKYHIEFGMPKSNILKIGKKECITMMPLGSQAMTLTTEYKYLGFNQTNKNKLEKHIKYTKAKTEGAYQKILKVAGDSLFKGIELKTIWELIDCEVAAIALNTSEVWDPTPKENKEHNQILDNIIKRTLKTPRSTPREALYIETGMLDLEARRHKNRINMRKRVMEKSTESTKITMNAPVKGGWSELTDALDARYGTANKGKEAVSKLVGIGFQKKIHTDGEEKSKIKYLLEGRQKNMEVNKKAEYLEWLNRNKASAVFLTRTRMFPAKNNFRSAHPSLTCRFCPHDEETQEHLLQECPGVHSDETTKVKKEDFFPQKFEYPKIWQTAANIEKVLEKIKKEEEPRKKRAKYKPKYPCTKCEKACRNGQNSIECDGCQKWTHLKCTNLTIQAFIDLSQDQQATWHCATCGQ